MPNVSSSVENLERGYSGTARTIEKMHELVAAGKLDPTINKIAQWIRLEVPGDYFGQSKQMADAIFRWVKKHGIFTRDQFQVEKIQHPLSTMSATVAAKTAGTYRGPGLFQGDCDDFSIWIATLGGILGFQYAFETAKVDSSRPDEFSHIWASLLVDGEWYPLDASTPSAYPGWRPPVGKDRIKEWPEKHIEEVSMSGLGLGRYGMGEDAPSEEGWSAQRYIPDVDPGSTADLVPDQPAKTYGEDLKVSEALYKAPARQPYQRDALIETEKQVPRYQNWGAKAVKDVEVSTPYPFDWPWARQVEVVYPGVVGLNGHRRRRPGMSGMGNATASTIPTADDWAAYYASPAAKMPSSPAVAAAAPVVEQSLTSQIFGAINSVANVFGGVTQAQVEAEKAKYQAIVSGAVGKVAPKPSSPYTLPILIGGGAVTVGLIAYFMTRK